MKKAISCLAILALLLSTLIAFNVTAEEKADNVLTPGSTWVCMSREKNTDDNEHLHLDNGAIGYVKSGDAVTIPDVDFGTDGYKTIALEIGNEAAPGSTMQITIGSLYGDVVADVNVGSTGGWGNRQTYTATFIAKITGTHDLTIRFNKAPSNIYKVTLAGTPVEGLPEITTSKTMEILPADSWELDGPDGPRLQTLEWYKLKGTVYENQKVVGYTAPDTTVLIKNVDVTGFSSVTIPLGVQSDTDKGFKVEVLNGTTVEATANVTVKGNNDEFMPTLGTAMFDNAITGTKDIKITYVNNGNLYGIGLGTMKAATVAPPPAGTATPDTSWILYSQKKAEGQILNINNSVLGYVQKGDAVTIPGLDFGDGYKTITLEVGNEGNHDNDSVQILSGGVYGDVIATINLGSTGDWNTKASYSADLNIGIKGVHDITVRFTNTNSNLFKVSLSGALDTSLPLLGTTAMETYPTAANAAALEITNPGTNTEGLQLQDNGNDYQYHTGGKHYGYSSPDAAIKIKGINLGTGLRSISLGVGFDNSGTTNNFVVDIMNGDTVEATANVAVKGSGDWNQVVVGTGTFDKAISGTKDIVIKWVNGGNLFGIGLGTWGGTLAPVEEEKGDAPFMDDDGNYVIPASTRWTLTPGCDMGKELKYEEGSKCIGYNKNKNCITSPALEIGTNKYKSVEIEYSLENQNGEVVTRNIDILYGGIFGQYMTSVSVDSTGTWGDKAKVSVDLPVCLQDGDTITLFFNQTGDNAPNIFNVTLKGDGSALPAPSADYTHRSTNMPTEDWDVEDSGGAEYDVELVKKHEYYWLSNYYGWMSSGNLITIPDIDFGTTGFSGIEIYTGNDASPGTSAGKIEVLVDDKLISTVDITGKSRDFWTFDASNGAIDYLVTGTHDIVLKYVNCSVNLGTVVLKGDATGKPDYSTAGGSEDQGVDKVEVSEVEFKLVDDNGNPLKNVKFTLNGTISKDGTAGEFEAAKTEIADKTYTTDENGVAKILIVKGEEYLLTFVTDVSSYGVDMSEIQILLFAKNASSYVYDAVSGQFITANDNDPEDGDDTDDEEDDEGSLQAGNIMPIISITSLMMLSAAMLLFSKKRVR